MTTPGFEEVRYDIIIEAKAAIASLKELLRNTENNDQKILEFTKVVQRSAKQWGVSWQYALGVYKELNKELSKTHKQTIFGNVGGKNLMDMSESYLKAADASEQYKKKVQQVDNEQKKAEQSAHGFRRSLDATRIAMGTLIAMGIFRFFNFLEESFRKAINGARQLELALYQLKNAERSLSEAGIDVTPQDFQNLISQLRELFPYLSKIDLTRMVSQIALLTKDLNLTFEQIQDLTKAAIIFAQRKPGLTIEQAMEQLVNGLTTSGKGWKDLGITVDAAVIKEEAINQKLVESEAAYNALTAEQRQHVEVLALISIANRSINNELQNQDEYQKTLDASTKATSAAWEDFLSKFGTAAAPAFIIVLNLLTALIEILTFLGTRFHEVFVQIASIVVANALVIKRALEGDIRSIQDYWDQFRALRDQLAEGWNQLDKPLGPDTPTSPVQDVQTDLDSLDTTKAQDEIEDLLKDLEQLDQKEVDIVAEFNEKDLREAEDHAKAMARAEEDYQIKRSRYIADSNAEIAEKNKQYREKEKNDEAKFQEELRQLRERFLFDLEDALRERDARQVLRLQEKYRMDKEAMINEHNLKKKDDAQQHANDIAQAKKEREDKLRQMDEDHRLEMQRKEEDYQIERERRLEDHQQELEDLKRQREERIREAAEAIAEELGIKGDGVQAIYEMLSKFYGPGGVFDGLYDYTNRSLVAGAQAMLNELYAIYAQAQAIIASLGGTMKPASDQGLGGSNKNPAKGRSNKSSTRNAGNQAFGGTYLATGPTRAVFGEQGPEVATFIPLGRSGASVGAGNGIVGQALDGKVDIQLLLSPDLEARIVNNTLEETASVVLKVLDSK